MGGGAGALAGGSVVGLPPPPFGGRVGGFVDPAGALAPGPAPVAGALVAPVFALALAFALEFPPPQPAPTHALNPTTMSPRARLALMLALDAMA